jgi:Rps23 Pro-64 3,4-dihydroxylase Tpa1-like proline 4-hydroxylase
MRAVKPRNYVDAEILCNGRVVFMINLTALKYAVPIISRNTLVITDLIHANFQQKLISQFPRLSFYESKRDKSHLNIDPSFTYKHLITEAITEVNLAGTMLSHVWRKFIATIIDYPYREKLGEIINADITKARWAIELAQYRKGDWLSEHYDQQKDKIATQLFYFNQYWDTTWGGYFHILHPEDHDISVLTIPPTINYSIITLTNPDAWHKVGKMQTHAIEPRLVMALQFYHT